MTATIRALEQADEGAYRKLRRFALSSAPEAFASSPEDDGSLSLEGALQRLSPERIAAGSITLGAFHPEGVDSESVGPKLIGMTTVHRETQRKLRHKAWIFGVFVSPEHRSSGVGKALMERAIEHARALEGVDVLLLGVTATSVAPLALYESLGFARIGLEPKALAHEGTYYDEVMMQLSLRPS
jgi:ribosomal protein S18 acetylase RimI-like enzyme